MMIFALGHHERVMKRYINNAVISGRTGYMDDGKFHVVKLFNDPRTTGRMLRKFVMLYARLHKRNKEE